MVAKIIRLSLPLLAASALLVSSAFFFPARGTLAPTRCEPGRVRFRRGEAAAAIRGTLGPCARRTYTLRALHGQKLSVRLRPEDGDLAFWVRSVGPSSRGLVLEGVHRNGESEWAGELPHTGEYAIDVGRRPVSDRAGRRVPAYRLEVRVE